MKTERTFRQLLPLLAAIFLVNGQLRGQNDCQSMLDSMSSWFNTGQYTRMAEMEEQILRICEQEVGKEDTLYANALVVPAILRLNNRDIGGGIDLLLESARIYEKKNQTGADGYASVLSSLSGAYSNMGEFAKARAYIEQSIAITLMRGDSVSTTYGDRLGNLALINFEEGQYDLAIRQLKEVVKIARAAGGGKDTPNYVTQIINLAVCYYRIGMTRAAYDLLVNLRTAIDQIDDPASRLPAIFANVFGLISFQLGQYAFAIQYMEKSRALFKQIPGADKTPDYANILNTIAISRQRLGQIDEALALVQEAYAITSTTKGKDHKESLVMAGNIATFYQYKGEPEKALPVFLETLQSLEKQFGKKSLEYITLQNNLATYYQDNGMMENALREMLELEKNYQEGIAAEGLLYTTILNNIGVVYFELGMIDSSRVYTGKALKAFKKSPNESPNTFGMALLCQSSIYELEGKTDSAMMSAQEAFDVFTRNEGLADQATYRALQTLTTILEKTGRKQEALVYSQQALASIDSTAGETHPDFFRLLCQKASLQEATGSFDAAFASVERADSLLRRYIGHSSGVYSYSAEEAFADRVSASFTEIANIAVRHLQKFPQASGMIYDNILTTNQILLQQTRVALDAARNSPDSATSSLARQWNDLRQLYAFQSGLPANNRQYPLDSLERAIAQAEQSLTAIDLPLRQARQKMNWQSVQAALKPGEAAIEFLRLPSDRDSMVNYYALVLRPGDKRPRMEFLFEEKQLIALTRKKSTSPLDSIGQLYPPKPTRANPAGQPGSLYRLVWQPLEKHLNGVKTVWFAPAGLLHRISFNAVTIVPGQYLSDRFELEQLSSTREVAFPRTPVLGKDAVHTARVFGGIRYDTDRDARLYTCPNRGDADRGYPCYLPGTLLEMRVLYRIFRANGVVCDTMSGYEAREDSIKTFFGNTSRPSDVLHIGTHGYFKNLSKKTVKSIDVQSHWADNPMFRSYLLMSGGLKAHLGNLQVGSASDGVLSAYEIATLNFTDTRLVTLSACVSALGEVRDAEGVYGLQRAFKMAGAQHLLVTLWPVDDAATQLFMEKFYTYWISDNMDIRKAFREARKEFQKSDPKYTHPYYWAAFVLI